MRCLKRCYSPLACSDWGYCRDRNQDGYPMTEREVARRRRESEEDELAVSDMTRERQ